MTWQLLEPLGFLFLFYVAFLMPVPQKRHKGRKTPASATLRPLHLIRRR